MSPGDDRRRPLPPLPELPAHLWRSSPLWARLAFCALIAAAAIAVWLATPGLRETERDRAAAENRAIAQRAAARRERLRRMQRPRAGSSRTRDDRSAARVRRIAARRRIRDDLEAVVLADARSRHRDPIVRTACDRYPRSLTLPDPALDLERRRGHYSCLAVTRDVAPSEVNRRLALGYPYRAVADFETGLLTWCRVAGRPAEGALAAARFVPVPRACGG